MTRCSNCGREVEGGQNFCPYCAQPLQAAGTRQGEAPAAPAPGAMQTAGAGRERFLRSEDLEPPSVVPLASFGEQRGESDRSQRKLFLVVGVASVVLLVALVGLFSTDAGKSLLQRASGGPRVDRLEGGLRAGSPEFDQYRDKVFVDFNPDEDAGTSPRPIGDVVVQMKPTIRNFTGRTLSGLELRGWAVDLAGNTIRERTFIVIPGRQNELEPNKTMSPSLLIEGIRQDATIANLKVEVTGFKFK